MHKSLTQKNELGQREWSFHGTKKLLLIMKFNKILDPKTVLKNPKALIKHLEEALSECGLIKTEDKRFWIGERYYIRILESQPKVVIYDSYDVADLFIIEPKDFPYLFEKIRGFWSSMV